MKSFEIAKSMTDAEARKCSEVIRLMQADCVEDAKSFIETMMEPERDKLLRFLEAKMEEWGADVDG